MLHNVIIKIIPALLYLFLGAEYPSEGGLSPFPEPAGQ